MNAPSLTPAERRRAKRIAFISFGFVEYCIPLVNRLAEHVEVLLVLPHQEVAPVRDEIAPTVRFLPFQKPRLRQPLGQARTALRIVRDIRRFRPDLVHYQQGHLWFNFALPLLGGCPLVLTIHDHRHHLGDRASRRTPQWIMDRGFRRADRLVVHGERLKDECVGMLDIPPEHVHVIPNLDRAGVGHAGSGRRAGGSSNVLFFGRIWPYKGLEYLIRAEPMISAAVPTTQIVIAGEGEDFEPYRRLMRNPSNFVVHNEFVSNEKRAELFRSADVVVLPYVEATQSAVVAVAYSYGKPVVATTVGGIPEIVEEERTGLLVPPRDEATLADAVIRLLRDPDLARNLGANGKRKIERDHSAENVARKTLAVYEELLSHSPPGVRSQASGRRRFRHRRIWKRAGRLGRTPCAAGGPSGRGAEGAR